MTRHVTKMGIRDALHISPARREEIIASYPPHVRAARTEGTPTLGAGAIYPVPEEAYVVQPFPIPEHWKRAYGMDVGWVCTAAIWIAEDPDTKVRYTYAEYARGESLPIIHAAAVKSRGAWIKGGMDPASRGRSQRDGENLMAEYKAEPCGLHLVNAINTVEAGLHDMWGRLETGRMKVFSTCTGLLGEARLYHRDEDGKVVKKDDHCMDGWRYANSTFDLIAATKPFDRAAVSTGHRAADRLSGY